MGLSYIDSQTRVLNYCFNEKKQSSIKVKSVDLRLRL